MKGMQPEDMINGLFLLNLGLINLILFIKLPKSSKQDKVFEVNLLKFLLSFFSIYFLFCESHRDMAD